MIAPMQRWTNQFRAGTESELKPLSARGLDGAASGWGADPAWPRPEQGQKTFSRVVIARNVPWNTRSVPRIRGNEDTDTSLEPGDTTNEVWMWPKRFAI